tara:strand:+ start:7079 stop:7336 length:258 start_codon:yes stop_codon:yes gene_type:complete
MTQQNKTELQEALEEMQHHFVQGNYPPNSHEHTVFKAAQKYADLPEKIEGMIPALSIFGESVSEIKNDERIETLIDILNLLKEEV